MVVDIEYMNDRLKSAINKRVDVLASTFSTRYGSMNMYVKVLGFATQADVKAAIKKACE